MADIGITKFRVQIPRDGATPSTPGFAQSEGQDPVNPPGSPTGIYVPYLGATGGVNLGEFGLTTGNLIFDTTPTNIPTAQGAMYWDADDETVALIMNGAIQKVGEDSFYQVKNQTGSNIAKGVAVRFAGTVGNSGRLLIAPFLADGTYPSTYFIGVTMEAIPNGEDGKVMWFGRIRGINTNAYNEGDILYASTTVAGAFQTTVPVAPNNIVEVCAVVTKSATVGTIFVRPTLGSNINRDEGVKIVSPATGDLLQRQSNGLFENRTIDGAGIVSKTGNQTILGIKTFQEIVLPTLSNNSNLKVGSLEFQSFALNNSWFGDNLFFNGTAFQRRATGFGSLFYFAPGGEGQFRLYNTGVAGSTISGFNVQFKIDYLGVTVAGGTSISNAAGVYTGATFRADSNGVSIGLNGSSPVGRLDVRGLGTGTGITLLLEDSAGNNTFEFLDNGNLSIPSANGAKIGTATSQKIALWNAAPIVQPTTGIAESAFVENLGGTIINEDSTFDGYTLRQVVKALRDFGLLA